jgi:hypothetical protein
MFGIKNSRWFHLAFIIALRGAGVKSKMLRNR